MKLYIANDHGGFKLKNIFLKEFQQIEWIDLGSNSEESVDYPDYAKKLCHQILQNPGSRGILICGSGQGVAMAANKFKNIRAALCWNTEVARLAREHNDANILCLGERVTEPQVAIEILKTFLNTDFAGGRHQRRVEKINE